MTVADRSTHRSHFGTRWFALAFLTILCLTSSPAWASIWYVNNQVGQDTNNGLAKDLGIDGIGPFRTIQKALKMATTSDTIVIANTGLAYNESLSICGPDNSGFPGMPFRIIGNGAILSGTQSTPARSWEWVAKDVYRFRPESAAYQQLYHGKRPLPFVAMDSDSVANKDFDQMQAMSWTLDRGYVYLKTQPSMLPDAFDLHHAYYQTGVTLYAVQYVAIENLIVQGFYLDGVNAHDNVKSSQLVNVTARGNGRSGVSVGGCSQLSLNSCLLGDNHYSQLRSESVAKIDLVGCSLLDNAQGPMIDRLGGEITESAGVQPATVPEAPASPADAEDDPFAG